MRFYGKRRIVPPVLAGAPFGQSKLRELAKGGVSERLIGLLLGSIHERPNFGAVCPQ
jgi:hypothetical protein